MTESIHAFIKIIFQKEPCTIFCRLALLLGSSKSSLFLSDSLIQSLSAFFSSRLNSFCRQRVINPATIHNSNALAVSSMNSSGSKMFLSNSTAGKRLQFLIYPGFKMIALELRPLHSLLSTIFVL